MSLLKFVSLMALAVAAQVTIASKNPAPACSTGPALAAFRSSPHIDSPILENLDLAKIRQHMADGSLDALQLTRYFIVRIATLDHAGPKIELNPDALELARQADTQRAAGAQLPLLGIPVLLKDNIDTADSMLTTAGSLAMTTAPSPRDASIVARLRKAGAVILGKANLSE